MKAIQSIKVRFAYFFDFSINTQCSLCREVLSCITTLCSQCPEEWVWSWSSQRPNRFGLGPKWPGQAMAKTFLPIFPILVVPPLITFLGTFNERIVYEFQQRRILSHCQKETLLSKSPFGELQLYHLYRHWHCMASWPQVIFQGRFWFLGTNRWSAEWTAIHKVRLRFPHSVTCIGKIIWYQNESHLITNRIRVSY